MLRLTSSFAFPVADKFCMYVFSFVGMCFLVTAMHTLLTDPAQFPKMKFQFKARF